MSTRLTEPVHCPSAPQGSNGQHFPDAPAAEEVRRQLRRIVSSADFVASPRNRRFLEHVVERTLRGETARGYEIGTLVFGRPRSFNATSDPIVRIEAGKLRRDLETYYLKSGKHDPIRIVLPKGAYRALFFRNEANVLGTPPSQGSLAILHAALLGLAGDEHKAAAAWRTLGQEYGDFALNAQAREALEAFSARDDRIRELLLDGLQRAARSIDFAPPERNVAFPQTP